MKTIKAQGTETRTSSEIDLFDGIIASDEVKERIAERVGDYLVEQILDSVGSARSPVQGESFSPLSKDYKDYKKEQGANPVANMELKGDMLNSLTFKATDNGVEVGFFDDQAWKADGHNHFSEASVHAIAPKRRFLPDEGQNFKPEIQRGVDAIIAEEVVKDIELSREDLKNIETKAEFYAVFRELLPGYSNKKIVGAIIQNGALLADLEEFGLLDYLDD